MSEQTSAEFEKDPYPGKPKILFIGFAESSHTHAWISLLDKAELNVRMFGLPTTPPPQSWPIRTYITLQTKEPLNPLNRAKLYRPPPSLPLVHFGKRVVRRIKRFIRPEPTPGLLMSQSPLTPQAWLAQIIQQWQPDIIHTLGLDFASYFYLDIYQELRQVITSKWVVQVRGGPDLAMHRLLPSYASRIRGIMQNCDQLIADNALNYEYAQEMRLTKDKLSSLGIVPGTGGIDIATQAQYGKIPPSKRERIIVWPKAFDCPQSKAPPVFEALKLAWNQIQPCEIYMLAVVQEEFQWGFQAFLPQEIRQASRVFDRIPRQKVLELMGRARIMFAPSISDGIPNSLYEAMASGAFPIVSPLETITPLVKENQNVLFARNLYPEELAQALIRAMTDDELVDKAAQNNLELVRRVADRDEIGPRVIRYYEQLAALK